MGHDLSNVRYGDAVVFGRPHHLTRRVRAVKTKAVSFRYFRAMQGPDLIPDYAAIPSRHFVNLFEVPVLFYVVCLSSMILQTTGPVMIGLAWCFVSLRVLQAIIHLSYNNIRHRMLVYMGGFGVVITMWTWLVVQTL